MESERSDLDAILRRAKLTIIKSKLTIEDSRRIAAQSRDLARASRRRQDEERGNDAQDEHAD
jgi:hypothetical protein